jgi:tetratricopeptide (TPR) repeat protein
VHMPSHIYQRVGRYEDAAEANRRAIKADSSYLAQTPGVGFYFMYVAHNYQFLWAAALMQGREAEALEAARSAVAQTPVEMLAQMPGLDFTLEYPVWTLVRFGRWEEVLKEPAPPVGFPYAAGAWRAARGIALAALGRLDEAAAEQGFLERAAEDVPPKATQGFNPARNLLGIASNLLAGRMAARKGKTDEAIRHLEEAVRLEDGLRYNEPSDWYYPVRPTLGAALLDAGRTAEAQAVFEADLQRNPENGWSLAGLAESLRRQKKEAEAAEAAQRLGKAWARADGPVEVSKL